MVKIEHLTFAYKPDSPVFSDFNWEIAPGERWSIIGPSGCGKTTLLYLLAGLRLPSAGKISLNGYHKDPHRPTSGLILQDYGLLPWATARENISLGLRIQGKTRQTALHVSQKWLSELGIEAVADRFPSEMSGGQRQRVAIARTLAIEPELLLMDEPFGSLDALTREEMQNLSLTLWQRTSITGLLVTHNIEEAVFWGSHILVLNHPPISFPFLMTNPGSGSLDYRNTPEFVSRCQQLRQQVAQNGTCGGSGERST